MKYRKKPIVIEAVQWFKDGDHPSVNVALFPLPVKNDKCFICGKSTPHGKIQTLEGQFHVCPGDWIVTGVAGEHYPVKPDIFAKTYEPVGDEA